MFASRKQYFKELLEDMEIIDCHEHLDPEKAEMSRPADVFKLFSHYCAGSDACVGDLTVAGMTRAQHAIFTDASRPLDERWASFKPHYDNIKNTAYCRAAHLALERFYGASEVTEQNYAELSERVRAANREGLYESVLRGACNIRTAVTLSGTPKDRTDGLFTYVFWAPEFPVRGADFLSDGGFFSGATTLAAAEENMTRLIDYMVRMRYAGVKMFAFPYVPTDRAAAVSAFEDMLRHPERKNDAVSSYLCDVMLDAAGKHDLPVCVHTGYWRDYRELSPEHLILLVAAHRDVRFDVYHVGYPYVREALNLGKTNPNVWLNMCWTYIISPKFAEDALTEMLQMLPQNKIFGFGGDYYVVEKVYGHLVMARDVISSVLAGQVESGYFGQAQAETIARKIMHDNAQGFYFSGEKG